MRVSAAVFSINSSSGEGSVPDGNEEGDKAEKGETVNHGLIWLANGVHTGVC